MPQIDTVGYITTTAGTLAAGFAIGWLTGRFDPKFQRLQLDLVSRNPGAVDRTQTANPDCYCTLSYGHAVPSATAAPTSAPAHWPPVRSPSISRRPPNYRRRAPFSLWLSHRKTPV